MYFIKKLDKFKKKLFHYSSKDNIFSSLKLLLNKYNLFYQKDFKNKINILLIKFQVKNIKFKSNYLFYFFSFLKK